MSLKVLKMEELCELYENLSIAEEEAIAGKIEIRGEVLSRMKHDSEIHGHFAISKRKNYKFTATVEQARELGATKTKEELDTQKMKKLYFADVKLPGEVIITEIPIIRNILGQTTE